MIQPDPFYVFRYDYPTTFYRVKVLLTFRSLDRGRTFEIEMQSESE